MYVNYKRDLTERGLWTPEVRNQIIADQGSVQNVRQIPQDLKDLYKTVWEIKQKFILNQVRVCVGVAEAMLFRLCSAVLCCGNKLSVWCGMVGTRGYDCFSGQFELEPPSNIYWQITFFGVSFRLRRTQLRVY